MASARKAHRREHDGERDRWRRESPRTAVLDLARRRCPRVIRWMTKPARPISARLTTGASNGRSRSYRSLWEVMPARFRLRRVIPRRERPVPRALVWRECGGSGFDPLHVRIVMWPQERLGCDPLGRNLQLVFAGHHIVGVDAVADRAHSRGRCSSSACSPSRPRRASRRACRCGRSSRGRAARHRGSSTVKPARRRGSGFARCRLDRLAAEERRVLPQLHRPAEPGHQRRVVRARCRSPRRGRPFRAGAIRSRDSRHWRCRAACRPPSARS